MTTYAFYHPRALKVDLADLTSALYQEIASLRGHIVKDEPPVLTCLGNGQPLYVYKHQSGRFFARHFPGGTPDGHIHPIRRMRAEHERQAEYCQRAASEAGLRAELEVSTGAGTRLDVAVFGEVPTGLEIQRSELTLKQAKSRTFKSATAGFTCAWISDTEQEPKWADHVPTARLQTRGGWEKLPPPGTANVIISKFDLQRDSDSRTGWRYQRRPFLRTLDELSQLVPIGEIVPVEIGSAAYRRVVLADQSAIDVINICTYQGAATWTPTPETPQTRESPQRFSSACHHGDSLAVIPVGDERRWVDPSHRCECGQPLWARESQIRGYCESCRLARRIAR